MILKKSFIEMNTDTDTSVIAFVLPYFLDVHVK